MLLLLVAKYETQTIYKYLYIFDFNETLITNAHLYPLDNSPSINQKETESETKP